MEKEEQFLEAFDKYSDALFRHCYFRLSDRERALELVQDCYMKTWDYVSQGKEVSHFKPFLYKVLNNLIIDEYRRKRPVSLDEILEQEGTSEGDFDELRDGDLASLGDILDAGRVLTLLEELPEQYREIVTLRYIDGLSPKEISELIEESENVVSVRIHRALAKLRKNFEYGT